jgi:hypothetical protein
VQVSGIGVAAHFQKHCPQRSFEIIERREALVELGIYLNILVFVLIQICRLLVLILNHGKKPMFWQMVLRLKAICGSC